MEFKPSTIRHGSTTPSPAQHNSTLLISPGLGSFIHCKEAASVTGRRLPLPVDERDHGGKDLLVQARGHALHTLHSCHLEPYSGEEGGGLAPRGQDLAWGRGRRSNAIITGLSASSPNAHTHVPLLLKLLTFLGPSSSVLPSLPGSCVTWPYLPNLHCDLLLNLQGSTQCHLLMEACLDHHHQPIKPIPRSTLLF